VRAAGLGRLVSAGAARRRQRQSGPGERLARANVDHEARFKHVFLISAAGRSADEILAALTDRLGNDPDTELREAG
jgi:2-oxo-4-hydroxy-4-carboxy--5-ureidoimidazoline (OHCU) decarboxylase